MKKLLPLLLLLFSLSSCQLWQKVLYGKDPCDHKKGRQMEKGHCKTETKLGY